MTDLDEQAEDVRGSNGRRESGGATINVTGDKRVTRFLDWLLPFLAIGALTYFANKVDRLSDAIVATNGQIAVMIEQNKAMQDGFKDHESRLRINEGDIRELRARVGPNYRSGPEVPRGR